MTTGLVGYQGAILERIEAAARTGAPAPTTAVLAGDVNCCPGTANGVLRTLARRGLITIESRRGAVKGRRDERRFLVPRLAAATDWAPVAQRRPGPGGLLSSRATTTRPCMCCTELFASEGIHNRLCQRCRTGSRGDGLSRGVVRVSGAKAGAWS